jgi:hypothetical protein
MLYKSRADPRRRAVYVVCLRLLAFWEKDSNPSEAYTSMSACCECCVLLGGGLWDGPITYSEESYRVCVSECDREPPREGLSSVRLSNYENKSIEVKKKKKIRNRSPLCDTPYTVRKF